VPTYCAAVRLKLRNPNTNPNFDPNPDLRPFEQKIDTPVTPALENSNYKFSAPFSFQLRSPCGTDRQTDGWPRPVSWPIRTAA